MIWSANPVNSVSLAGTSRVDREAPACRARLRPRRRWRAELRVLGEDRDVASFAFHQGGGGRHVLGSGARAEGVVVHPGDGVGGSRSGDVEDVVLFGEAGELNGNPRHDGPGDDVHSLAHQVGGLADRRFRVAAVVGDEELDRPPVHRSGAVGGVVEPRLQACQVLLAVGLQRARRRVMIPTYRLAARFTAGVGGRVGVVGSVVAGAPSEGVVVVSVEPPQAARPGRSPGSIHALSWSLLCAFPTSQPEVIQVLNSCRGTVVSSGSRGNFHRRSKIHLRNGHVLEYTSSL